jgi:hypothetical protein
MMQFKNKKAQQLYYVFEMYNAVNEIERDNYNKQVCFENVAFDNDKISDKALKIINKHMNYDQETIEFYKQQIKNYNNLSKDNPFRKEVYKHIPPLDNKIKLIEQRLMLVRILIADLDILEKTNTNEILQLLKD